MGYKKFIMDTEIKIVIFILINVVLMVVYSVYLGKNSPTSSKIIKLSIWIAILLILSSYMTTYDKSDSRGIILLGSSEIAFVIGLINI